MQTILATRAGTPSSQVGSGLGARASNAPQPALQDNQWRDVIVLGSSRDADELARARQMLQDQGAQVGRDLRHAAGFVARIPRSAEHELTATGLQVYEDALMRPEQPSGEGRARATAAMTSQASQPPALGPSEALSYDKLPYTGKGVTIAILDSGVAAHPDLEGRLVAFHDVVEGRGRPVDEFGHGTHVAGDAAGSGALSHGRFRGPAPEAGIVGIRVLGGGGEGERLSDAVDQMVEGLEWMVANKDRYGIRVANLSLGMPLVPVREDWLGRPTALLDPIGEAIDKAVEAGIVVVVAAGNDGREGSGTIAQTPAINPNVITVGALDTQGTPVAGDDEVADFSSRGPTPTGDVKPDVLAPGVNIMSLNAPGSELEHMNLQSAAMKQALSEMDDRQLAGLAVRLVRAGMAPPAILRLPVDQLREVIGESVQSHPMAGRLGSRSPAYLGMDGTSMASPIVAGICADIIEANPSLSPEQVKAILMKTARPLPHVSAYAQGAGVVDAQAAVTLAERMRTYPSQRFEAAPPPPRAAAPTADPWDALFGGRRTGW